MASYFLSPISTIIQYFSDTGVILSGGKITTYIAGSTTPTDTWTDSTGSTKNSNPIVLNSAGRLPNVQVWQAQNVSIKAIVTDANNNQIGPTFDYLAGINDVPVPAAVIFSSYRSSSTQNLPASTTTTLIFNAVSTNPQSAYNASNGVFTVLTAAQAGTYIFSVSVALQNNAINSGTLNGIYISVNNSDLGVPSVVYFGAKDFNSSINGSSNGFINTVAVTLTLALNDTVRIKVSAGAGFGGGGQFNMIQGSFFSGLRIPGT
jgi:hypothetical protein